MNTQSKYAIIGAGPSGLSAARNLQRFDIDFDGYERHSGVGGLWDIDNERSTVYESAHLISSKGMTEFKEFPMDESVADYPGHRELCAYFRNFAETFNITEKYHFNTEVRQVEPAGNHWDLTLSTGETRRYAGVIVANGTLSEPNMPQFSGKFNGELIHSARYKSAAVFEGKRVLIVGAGNSGCDIAVDAIHRARRTAISVRRGYHFVPKYVFGRPADTMGGLFPLPPGLKQKIDGTLLKLFTGDPQKLGFPKPDHKLYESHPIVNTLVLYHLGHGDLDVKADIERLEGDLVVFKDGSQEPFDMIVLATGYKLHFPFIDRKYLNWEGAMPRFYLNTFHPQYHNLFILGMIEAAGIGWQGRYLGGELIARYIASASKNPAAYERFNQRKRTMPDMSGGYKYLKLDRMAYYVHKETFLKLLTGEIKRFEK